MTLNIDCVRDVLVFIEEQDYPHNAPISDFVKKFNNYSASEIEYTCIKLYEGEYLNLDFISNASGTLNRLEAVGDITFQGHEFLNNIHSDTTWKHIKQVSSKVGATSLNAVIQIATRVVTALINQQIGL